MEFLTDYNIWVSFITLSALEIVLGIDNVVFIALLVSKLPKERQQTIRVLGLALALLMRIAILFAIAWIISLKEPWISLLNHDFSGKDLLMLIGGGFLLIKGTNSIHEEVSGDIKESGSPVNIIKSGAMLIIAQIVFIDIIFSFDSVMTAVGLTEHVGVIIAAMTLAMVIMVFSSSIISSFIEKFPTLKILALSFIMLIGIFLVAEGFGLHVPKAYIYFSMAFALSVETLNLMAAARQKKRNSL